MKSLGDTLKSTRESLSLTLRQVEDAVGISNAYLSQLENEKIKKPSANILYKLANLYKIDLNVLLRSAGIIKQEFQGEESEKSKWEQKIAFYDNNLTDEEKKDVLDFIQFKLSKKK